MEAVRAMGRIQALGRDRVRPHGLRPTILDHQDWQADRGLVRGPQEAVVDRDSGVLLVAMRHAMMSTALASSSNAEGAPAAEGKVADIVMIDHGGCGADGRTHCARIGLFFGRELRS